MARYGDVWDPNHRFWAPTPGHSGSLVGIWHVSPRMLRMPRLRAARCANDQRHRSSWGEYRLDTVTLESQIASFWWTGPRTLDGAHAGRTMKFARRRSLDSWNFSSEFWVHGTFSSNVKVQPVISWNGQNSFQRIFPFKFSAFYYPLHHYEFGQPKFFSKTFELSIIFYSTWRISGGGQCRKACRSRVKESKQSKITWKLSEPVRSISNIEKRREFVRALWYEQCPKKSSKRLYTLEGLLALVEKASFSKEFRSEFHSGGGGYTLTSGAVPFIFLFWKESFKCLWEILVD